MRERLVRFWSRERNLSLSTILIARIVNFYVNEFHFIKEDGRFDHGNNFDFKLILIF